jgi:hypothetical protein
MRREWKGEVEEWIGKEDSKNHSKGRHDINL